MIGGITFLKPITDEIRAVKWLEQRQTGAACPLLTRMKFT